jgi:hyperosmotically inducible protein
MADRVPRVRHRGGAAWHRATTSREARCHAPKASLESAHGAVEAPCAMAWRAEEEAALRRQWQVRCAIGVMALLMLVGCATMASRENGGDVSEDAAITAKVQASFAADPLVSASAINVETRHGLVHLTGTVKSEQERQRAIELVQGVAGVRGIVRNLVVER